MYREDLIHNQDAFGQQENEEILLQIDGELSEDDETDINDIPENNFESQLPASSSIYVMNDDEINEKIRSLNKKQREIFDVIFTWAKRFVQNRNACIVENVDPFHIFLTGGGGCGKSHLIKCVYHSVTKLLNYHFSELEKPKILLLAPTGVSAINIEATTIHTGLGIPCNRFYPLSDKLRTQLRNKLLHVSLIIIDEISMVSSKLLFQIHQRLCEIFGTSDQVPFAGKSILVCGDLYQLPPVMAHPVFSTDGFLISMFKLWHLFKLAELDEIMRQQGDKTFINLLNNIRVGNILLNDENLINSKFISKECPSYPWHALHLYAENAFVNEHNKKMLEYLQTEVVIIAAIDEFSKGTTEKLIRSMPKIKVKQVGLQPT